jgi:uncharacterized membrane protein YphA (DoxX/SURF4 family)
MKRLLWILQIVLAAYFMFNGINHFLVPANLPERMAWMYDLSPAVHLLAGTAEVLAALGLVLPGLTRIQPGLTPLAALGLVVVMLAAASWHITRGEGLMIFSNFMLAGLSGFIAYGRWRLSPL